MKNLFTKHPHAIGETYFQHLKFAFIFGKNISPDFDMTVDPKQLQKLLSYVFDTSDFVEADY